MEYQTAHSSKKKIFAFFANEMVGFENDKETDDFANNQKRSKLQELKQHVQNNYLTHPEHFNSPFQLSLMVAESIMKASMNIDQNKKEKPNAQKKPRVT